MKTFFMLLIVLSIISCYDSPTQVEEPSKKYYSGEKSIDLNNDGKDDLRWELEYIGNEMTSDVFYSVWPQNDSRLLYINQLGRLPFEIGDTIKFESIQPLRWSPFRAHLASKRMNTGQWRGRWVGKTAYMPIKISINDSMHCGWVNLTIDTLNQKVIFNYSDYNIQANSDFIIID
jgi:hypothetical protein